MITYELNKLRENPDWITLLGTYAEAKPLENGKLSRMDQVDDFDEEELAEIHGKLIAWGFLDFELSDMNLGIQYQVTTLGRQGLLRIHTSEESSPGSPTEEQTEEQTESETAVESTIETVAIAG